MAEVTLSKKRKLSVSENTCCFCFRPFDDEKPTTLDLKCFDKLLESCRSHFGDATSSFIIENEKNIREGKINVRYHKQCRASFVHPFYTDKNDNILERSDRKPTPEKFTRSTCDSDKHFDWKQHCFICGNTCSVKKRSTWSMVESSTKASSIMYCKVLEAAQLKNDQQVLTRLLSSGGDLVAKEARYHRTKNCYQMYVYQPEKQTKQGNTKCKTLESIGVLLMQEYKEAIEIHKKVFELPTLKASFIRIAKENGLSLDNIQNRTLTSILHKVWPGIRIIQRPGLSNIVCSKSVSLNEALQVACRLGKDLSEKYEEDKFVSEISNSDINDEHILHMAAGILRQRLKTVDKLDKEYFSSDEISLDGQKQFVDKYLLKFLGWITSEDNFVKSHDINDDIDQDPKLLAICCDLMFAATSVVTPKHLGLTVHLHHLYGSRKLIDDLFNLGYTMSYTELRHFLTSAASHMTNTQRKTPSGALVPSDIKRRDEGGQLILAAGDNWDHNESTADGKRTTHAMTTILVFPKSNKMDQTTRIIKRPDRTFESASVPGASLSTVLVYHKPTVRPCPVLTPPPTSKKEVRLLEPEAAKILKLKDILYNLGRSGILCDDLYEKIPPWSIYQSNTTIDNLQEQSEVVFNPIIMSTPTHYNTVYTTLIRVKEQLQALGQTSCPVVFDMGLLTKALEVVWAKKSELDGVIPIEGGMHFLMSVFAGIGFLYGDAGLKQLLSDSDVFAHNTATQILAGKDFDRGMRAFLMVDEVLWSRLLLNFQKWCEINNHTIVQDKLLKFDKDSLSETLTFLSSSIVPLLDKFRAKGREISPTFQFWDDYLRYVSTPLKLFLSASRHAMWEVYEYSKSLFLPFLFASNRSIYARYMPYMILRMQRLPNDVQQSFVDGNFMAKLTTGRFNSVWMDYCLEVTENKCLKSSGGIIGLTHRDNALGRWFLSRPITAKYSSAYEVTGLEHIAKSSDLHHSDNPSSRKAFNENVQKMVKLFVDQIFVDPFCIADSPPNLVNLATGISVSPEVEVSLLNCFKKASDCLDQFVEERLVVQTGSSSPEKSFYDPVPKVGTKPMSTKQKRVKVQSTYLPINGEEMYLRLLSMNSFKKVPLKRVMAFENAPVPTSLFYDDGQMISGKKADFMIKLEELINNQHYLTITGEECIIYDGMAIIQMLQPSNQPDLVYSDMANTFWHYILSKSKGAPQIHVVFDWYIDNSAKSQTRHKRGDQKVCRSFVIQSEMRIPDWKQALGNTDFKRNLTNYYTKHLTQNAVETLSNGQTVFVSGGLCEEAIKVTSEVVSFVSQLFSNQEEADTRMLLHARYVATEGVNKLTVVSPDTDVLVLLIHHFSSIGIPSIFFKTGRKSIHIDMTRYIPVHDIVKKLSQDQIDIILPVYCITGCDTCSFLFGIGKKSAFKLLIEKASQFSGMCSFGDLPDLTTNHILACTEFVGELYGKRKCTFLNELRVEKVVQNKHTKPRRLPPTDNSFSLHLQRCLYQLIVWKSALIANVDMPCLSNYGYIVDISSGLTVPQPMSQSPAAPELLSDLVCCCKDVCEANCVCSSMEQPCTIACPCNACTEQDVCCMNIYTFLAIVE